MSLQTALKANYKPQVGHRNNCSHCAHARPSRAAPTMKVCRQHEVTVHPQGGCALFKAAT